MSLALAIQGRLDRGEAGLYVGTQVAAALCGTASAHLMFGEAAFSISTRVRAGPGQWWSEVVATGGLLLAVLACAQRRSPMAPAVLGVYITAAYWFTASTSFANPALTLARAASHTFAGIPPSDVAPFIAAQLVGGAAALLLHRRLFSRA